MTSVCVAFKAHLGWTNSVAVEIGAETPTPLHAERVDLYAGEDREVVEPYHVAGGWSGLERVARPANPAAMIHRGRAAQVAAAKTRLEAFRRTLEAGGYQWSRAVVLTGRGRLGADLEHILGSHAHIHIAEGESVRDATRAALDALGIPRVDQDEKSITGAAERLLDGGDCDALMKERRPPQAKSWAREERLLALGAWLNRT